jgi:hypothetical protein
MPVRYPPSEVTPGNFLAYPWPVEQDYYDLAFIDDSYLGEIVKRRIPVSPAGITDSLDRLHIAGRVFTRTLGISESLVRTKGRIIVDGGGGAASVTPGEGLFPGDSVYVADSGGGYLSDSYSALKGKGVSPLDTLGLTDPRVIGRKLVRQDSMGGADSYESLLHRYTDVTVSFPTPTTSLVTGADLQEFRVLVRKKGAGTNPPCFLYLYESGVYKNLAWTATISNTTGIIMSAKWDASALTDVTGAGVELRVYGDGTPNGAIEVGAIEWNATRT